MQATVYRLRDRGIKLPRPFPPVAGEVLLAKVDRGDLKYLQAKLVVDSREVLPSLHQAIVSRVTRNGMVIHGTEMAQRVPGSGKAKVSKHPQTWWVLVVAEAPAGVDALEEIANGDDPINGLPYAASLPLAWQRARGTRDGNSR